MAETTPVMFEGNDVRLIPQDQVQLALQNGGKVAQKMLFGSDARWIPQEEVDNARKSGGQLMGTSPQAPAPPDMQKQDLFQPQDHGVVSGVVRAGKAIAGLPSAIGHAFTDPARDQDEQMTEGVLGKTLAKPVEGVKRLFIDPQQQAFNRGQELELRAAAESDPRKKKVLEDAAGSYKIAAFVPLVGAPAANMAERAGTGNLDDPNNKMEYFGKDSDPWGALAEGLTYAMTPKIAKEATRLAKLAPGAALDLAGRGIKAGGTAAVNATTDAAASAAQSAGRVAFKGAVNVAKGAAGAATDMASEHVSNMADALKEHFNNVKADIADQVHQVIKRPSGLGMHADIQDIIEKSSNNLPHIMDNAGTIAADLLNKIKTNASTAGAVTQDLVDRAVNRVTDEYYLRKNPSVSGGSQGADVPPSNLRTMPNPEQGAIDEHVASGDEAPHSDQLPANEVSPLKNWNSQEEPAPDFRPRGTVNPHSPEATVNAGQGGMLPPFPGKGTPGVAEINEGVGVGADNQPLRTPLAQLAKSEPWAKDLWDVLTRGQRQGGSFQALETGVRRAPVLGRMFEQGDDVFLKDRLTKSIREAALDKSLGRNVQRVLAGAEKDFDQAGRINWTKTVNKLDDLLNSPHGTDIFDPASVAKRQSVYDAARSAVTRQRVEVLRDALDQANKDIQASTRFGAMTPTPTISGTIIKIAQHLGLKGLVRHLITPSEMDEMKPLIRILSNVPRSTEAGESAAARVGVGIKNKFVTDTSYTESPIYKALSETEKRLVDRQAETLVNRFKRMWKGASLPAQPPRVIQPGQAPLPVSHPEWNIASAHPGSHAFSFRQYLQNNPNSSPDDARQAGRDAEAAGYEVNA
jgi:hypothetical protein